MVREIHAFKDFWMAGDLERFLQQAAERLAEKLNQAQGRPPARKEPPRSVRQAERQRLEPDIVDAEIARSQESNPRELGPDRLSSLDTRHALPSDIARRDERMQQHIDDVMDHDIVHLKNASSALADEDHQSSDDPSQVDRREREVSSLIRTLRDPETLRAAFIVGQIFNRKF